MFPEHTLLPKPNQKINTEWLSSLETKTGGLQVCIFPSSLEWDLRTLNAQHSLVQKLLGHGDRMAQHEAFMALQYLSNDLRSHLCLQGVSHRDTTEAFAYLA